MYRDFDFSYFCLNNISVKTMASTVGRNLLKFIGNISISVFAAVHTAYVVCDGGDHGLSRHLGRV